MAQVSNEIAHFFWTQDLFYPFRDWPDHYRDKMLQRHKSNLTRYVLFKFLAYNGLHWQTAIDWITMGSKYDRSAYDQLNWLAEQHRTGMLYSSDKGYTWDMHHKKTSDQVGIQILKTNKIVYL